MARKSKMECKALDTVEASNPQAARIDAARKSAENAHRYSKAGKGRAEIIRKGLAYTYAGELFVTFRQKFIAVKATGEVIKKGALIDMENNWISMGVVKRVTPQGTIYRLPR